MTRAGLCIAFTASIAAGCASTEFRALDDDIYEMYRWSDACAAGSPSAVLDGLRAEATKFCASRKEIPVEVSSESQYGIPVIRCADATLRFRCEPK